MSLALTLSALASLFASEVIAPPVESASVRPVFSVVPGGSGSPLAAGPKGGAPRLVWTGFQVTDEGSRVFVQTTAEVELEVVTGKGGVTVTLHNCRIHMRNNSRTLDTRFFTSPVQQVSVHQRHRDVKLDIALKGPAQPTQRQEAGPDGTHFWVIDFAASEKAVAPAPAPAPTKSISLK
jgi:hypothetical protein